VVEKRLRTTGIEHGLICEIDTSTIINKCAMEKSRKWDLKQKVCCFWQSTSTFIQYLDYAQGRL